MEALDRCTKTKIAGPLKLSILDVLIAFRRCNTVLIFFGTPHCCGAEHYDCAFHCNLLNEKI